MNNNSIFQKIFLLLMMIILLVSGFLQSKQDAYAHSVYYLAVTVDASSYVYTGSVYQDDESFWSKESKHMEYSIGEFDDIVIDDRNVEAINDDGTLDLTKVTNAGKKEYLAFSLPSKENDDKRNAGQAEIDRIYLALDYVVQGLNDAVVFLNGGKNPESVEELQEITAKLLVPTVKVATGHPTHDGEKYTMNNGVPSGFKVKSGFKAKDYVTITRESDGEFIVVPFQLDKAESDDIENVDAKYFHWGGFALHAFQAYEGKEIMTQNIATLSKPSKLTEMVTDLIGWMTNELRSLLGLYSINDLIFNEGSRGSNAFIHGTAPKSWVDSALTYHLIFQGFAISLIMFAIIKTLLQRNLATVNTNLRVSLIEGFQNIIVSIILLALLIPLMNSLMYLNFVITGFFGTTVPDYTDLGATNSYTNLLGGVILQLVYFGITLYYNFVYIIRSITLTILIAIGPLFVVAFAFGGAWKNYFFAWLKEFVANVFMQSFHALMLSLFFTFTLSSRGIEGIVVLMAIIPLSNFFRQLIFGNSGDATSSIGMNSLGMMTALGSSALNQTSKMLPSRTNASNAVATTANAKAGANNGATSNMNNSKANSNAGKLKTTSSTNVNDNNGMDNSRTVTPANAQYQGTGGASTVSPQALQERMQQVKKNNPTMSKLKTVGNAAKTAAQFGGDGARALAGAASLATGYGVGMALGTEDFKMMKAGQTMNEAGTNAMNKGSQGMLGDAKQGMDSAVSAMKNRYNIPGTENIKATQYDNGDIEVSESLKTFQQTEKGQAINDAFMDNDNNLVMFYNQKKLNPSQKAFFKDVQSAYTTNDTDRIEQYRKMGIQSVGQSNNGDLAVSYNQEGKRAMGIRNMNIDKQNHKVNVMYSAGGQIGDNVEAATIKPHIPPYPQPDKNGNGNGSGNRNNNR